MNLTTNNQELLAAMQKLATVVDKRQTMPVLGMVRIVATGNNAELTATDLEVTAVATIDATVTSEGAVCIPADKLLAAAKAARYDIDIKTDGSNVTVESGRRSFTLQSLPATEFPAAESYEMQPVECDAVTQALRNVAYAMAQNDVRHFLNGAYMECISGQLVAVGTDGHRIAVSRHSASGDDFNCILPRKAVHAVMSMFQVGATFAIGRNHASFTHGALTMVTKLIDGKFPDWRRVVPEDRPSLVTCDPDELVESMTAMLATANVKNRSVAMTINKSELVIESHNEAKESGRDVIACHSDNATGMTFGVNCGYLIDAIKSLGMETVGIKYDTPNASLRLDFDGQTAVVMPVRL